MKFKIIKTIFISFVLSVSTVSCKKQSEPIVVSTDDYFNAVDQITQIMVHDIFSPPVASRVYVYPNIAAYEIVAYNDANYTSLAGQLEGLTSIPTITVEKKEFVNYNLAAIVAHLELSKKLVFSEERLDNYKDSIYSIWEKQNPQEFKVSEDYGLLVVNHITKWMDKDNYNKTRTMPKYTVNYDAPERWQPTPPAYMNGIEPHWGKIRPFALTSSDQFKPIPPPAYSLDKESLFYKELKEVYDVTQNITKEGDNSEGVKIAQFWDCNPYVSVTRGHLMFATKKISPGAHWVGITKIASKSKGIDFNEAVYANTKVTIAIADGFISCWDEKYRSNLVRPETIINNNIDDKWKPILQTPPFPEYVSGHSVVSGAASEILTEIFGDNFAFNDDTETAYGLPIRNFTSFRSAAQEAALSRLYGGIHYRAAIDVGLKQGIAIGNNVNSKLKMIKE
jgi:hypothetical protein